MKQVKKENAAGKLSQNHKKAIPWGNTRYTLRAADKTKTAASQKLPLISYNSGV